VLQRLLMLPLTSHDTDLGHPLKFISWNVNGIGSQLRKPQEWKKFRELIEREKIDIIAFQEVSKIGHSFPHIDADIPHLSDTVS
jgi:hypothetical protein